MSLPVRVSEYAEGATYYPLQLVLKDGQLCYLGTDGSTVNQVSNDVTIDNATSSVSGIVKLSDAVDSTSDASSSVAATPAAVKKAYEQIRVLSSAPSSPSVGEIWIIES